MFRKKNVFNKIVITVSIFLVALSLPMDLYAYSFRELNSTVCTCDCGEILGAVGLSVTLFFQCL